MTALLIIAAAVTGYALFVLASPTTGCRRCGGLRQHRLRSRAVPVAPEGPVVGEERPPGLIDGAGIIEVPLVQLVDQPLIGAEVGAGRRDARLRRLTRPSR